tara:strand:+ start:60 stop:299 length:240 start_codon:yes stop_codon:yes gene_type:complete
MKRFFTFLGYALIIFAFLDFLLSWIYPDLLMSWYIFSNTLLGGLAVITPIIFYVLGSFLIKFGSDENDNIEEYHKSENQ